MEFLTHQFTGFPTPLLLSDATDDVGDLQCEEDVKPRQPRHQQEDSPAHALYGGLVHCGVDRGWGKTDQRLRHRDACEQGT